MCSVCNAAFAYWDSLPFLVSSASVCPADGTTCKMSLWAQTARGTIWWLLNVRAPAELDNAELVLGVRCLIPAQSHHTLTDITHKACLECLLFAFNVSLACLDSVVSCSFGAVPFLMFSASVFLSDSTTCKGSFQSQLGADRSIQILVTARCQCTCNARRCRAGIRRAMSDTSSIASHSHRHYT